MALLEPRNDLHLTTTGISHDFRGTLPFPPENFQRSFGKRFPPSIGNDEIVDHHRTTSGSAHNYKPTESVLSNAIHKKAPAHWKVGYVGDLLKKLQVKPWRQPLTMGNQSSEMKAQYTGKPVVPMSRHLCSDLQPPVYRDHHNEGPLKKLVPSTQNPELSGQKYYVSDRGVLGYHSDMYLTTTQKDHRAFKKAEMNKYPKKQYATYWECEEYPTAWGHGSTQNPLPPNSVPREKGPMRDQIWFKTATMLPRMPKSSALVPNKGMRSEVMANFTSPDQNKREELFTCTVGKPWDLESPGPKEVFSIPKMYEIESQFYGSRIPVNI